MSSDPVVMPVFPLNIPLFPGCKLSLQIFEQRYLTMISDCMNNASDFIVALLKTGHEKNEVINPKAPAGSPECVFYPVGTKAKIVDFGQQQNGLLNITIEGLSRYEIYHPIQREDGLWLGEVIERAESGALENGMNDRIRELMNRLLNSGLASLESLESQIEQEQVMNYLSMYLPLPTEIKQQLLEENELNQRWQQLKGVLREP